MLPRFLIALAALALAAPTMASAETLETDRTWYFRNGGGGCGTSADFYLSTVAGGAESNCGYQGGLSLGETPVIDSTKTFATRDGMPVTLNADVQDATGVVNIRNYSGLVGVGQVVIDIALRGRKVGGGTVSLASTSVDGLVTETGSQAFAFTLDLVDSADEVEFSELSLDVVVRGYHALTGYVSASNGESSLTVPIIIEIED